MLSSLLGGSTKRRLILYHGYAWDVDEVIDLYSARMLIYMTLFELKESRGIPFLSGGRWLGIIIYLYYSTPPGWTRQRTVFAY